MFSMEKEEYTKVDLFVLLLSERRVKHLYKIYRRPDSYLPFFNPKNLVFKKRDKVNFVVYVIHWLLLNG